jgi:truncated hemoglobin YjbI
VAILRLNVVRDLVVYDPAFNATENDIKDQSLYERIGKIEGIIKLMATVFNYIKQDEGLFKFYKDKEISVIQKKYAYYIAG